MGTIERAGVKDSGQVEMIDVSVPDVPEPTLPLPTPPDAPTPVQAALTATLETTGADPPPAVGEV